MSKTLDGPPQWPAQRHPYKRLRIDGEIVIIDELLADVVRALNRAGAQTEFCCQGNHRADEDQKIGLSGAYITVKRKLPKSLIDHAQRYGFKASNPRHLYATPPALDLPLARIRANNRRFVRMLRKWAESE